MFCCQVLSFLFCTGLEGGADPLESMLYAVFVAINERLTVSSPQHRKVLKEHECISKSKKSVDQLGNNDEGRGGVTGKEQLETSLT